MSKEEILVFITKTQLLLENVAGDEFEVVDTIELTIDRLEYLKQQLIEGDNDNE